jgi:hypothetical protein
VPLSFIVTTQDGFGGISAVADSSFRHPKNSKKRINVQTFELCKLEN